MIYNTVCSLLLRESKIYREIEVVNMWWTTIIVVALLAFGIVGFVSMVRLFAQRLTSETTRRAEDMYDQYADSPREWHRRSLAPRRYWAQRRDPWRPRVRTRGIAAYGGSRFSFQPEPRSGRSEYQFRPNGSCQTL